MLNWPSNQSKPSSFKLFCVISTNFASISTCFGPGDIGLLDQRVDQLQIVLRVAHDQAAALRQKVCARSGRKWHALGFEKFLGAFAIHELTATGRFLGVLAGAGGRRDASSRGRRGLIQRGLPTFTVLLMKPGGTRYSFVSRSLLCSLIGIIETAYGSTFTFKPAWLAM